MLGEVEMRLRIDARCSGISHQGKEENKQKGHLLRVRHIEMTLGIRRLQKGFRITSCEILKV